MLLLLFFAFAILFWLRVRVASRIILLARRFGCSLSGSIWLYALMTLPGVLLHEISHFLTAALFGLRTGTIALLPMIHPDGGVELGSVQVEKCDPFRQSIVGLAPLLFGLPMVIWLSTQLIPLPFSWDIFHHSWGLIFWLKTYALITFSLHLFPSRKDMAAWPIVGLLFGVFAGTALIMGFKMPSSQLFATHVSGFIYQSTYGVGLAIVASCCLLLVIESLLFLSRRKSFGVQ